MSNNKDYDDKVNDNSHDQAVECVDDKKHDKNDDNDNYDDDDVDNEDDNCDHQVV